MRALVFLFLIVTNFARAGITEGGRGLLFGAGHAFEVSAKTGWMLDNQSGVAQGLHMVFYPKGESWSASPVIIYGMSVGIKQIPTINAQVAKTLEDIHGNGNPQYKAARQPVLKLPGGAVAEIYYYSGDQWGNYEAVAYFKESESINFLVFNAKSKADFERFNEDFRQIAASYRNLYSTSAFVSKQEFNLLTQQAAADLAQHGGKDYEAAAIRFAGSLMSNAMQSCTAADAKLQTSSFTYFVQITKDGKAGSGFIYPANDLSKCFYAAMTAAEYPAHNLTQFILQIDMKTTP